MSSPSRSAATSGCSPRASRPSPAARSGAVVLHLPPRTLARRKRARRLSADESDRLLRLARVGARAEEVFGSAERAGTWLRGTVRALGGVRLFDLLDTDLGAQQVEQVLGRIEHGVHS